MARPTLSRAVCLLLVLLLASSALFAAADRHVAQTPKPAPVSVWSQAWARVVGLIAFGSEMGPLGGKLKSPASPTADLGSEMDPDGAK